MEEKLIAFINSRINDAMRQARQVVQEAIEELPLTQAWLFEESPALTDELEESYLRWVGKCDLFILLLGEDITDPVRTEWESATQARQPRLVFLEKGAQNEEAWAFAKGLNVKWKEYEALDQLKRQVQAAVGDELIKGYRAYGVIELVGVQREREGQAIRRRVQGWLTALLETGALTALERAAAGDVLAHLGDPRFDPQALSLPREPLFGFHPSGPRPLLDRQSERQGGMDP